MTCRLCMHRDKKEKRKKLKVESLKRAGGKKTKLYICESGIVTEIFLTELIRNQIEISIRSY